jgi:hypothetical protein
MTDNATHQCPVCAAVFGPSNAPGKTGRWAKFSRHVHACAASQGKAAAWMGDPRVSPPQDCRWFVVDLPDGWRHVRSGRMKPGDMAIDCFLLWDDGLVSWTVVDVENKEYDFLLSIPPSEVVIRHDAPIMSRSEATR